jgi:hypothetical protein
MFVEESADEPDSDALPEAPIENPAAADSFPTTSHILVPHTPSPRDYITSTSNYGRILPPLPVSSPDERRTISSIGISPKPVSGPSPLPSVSSWADLSPSLSSLSPNLNAPPAMTSREAFLLRSFIQNYAPRVCLLSQILAYL